MPTVVHRSGLRDEELRDFEQFVAWLDLWGHGKTEASFFEYFHSTATISGTGIFDRNFQDVLTVEMGEGYGDLTKEKRTMLESMGASRILTAKGVKMAGADVADDDKEDLKSAMARFGAVAVRERVRDPKNYEDKLAAALQDVNVAMAATGAAVAESAQQDAESGKEAEDKKRCLLAYAEAREPKKPKCDAPCDCPCGGSKPRCGFRGALCLTVKARLHG